MLHTVKKVSSRYYKRIRGLVRYILDYQILLFSLSYIFFTFLMFQTLRNIKKESAMGLLFLVLLVLTSFLMGLLLLRNIRKKKSSMDLPQKGIQRYEHFFRMGIFVLTVVLISSCRIMPVVDKEIQIEGKRDSFMNEDVSFEGYILEESDKRYQIQQLKVKQLQDIYVKEEKLSLNHGYILVKVDNYEKFTIGQVCEFRGTLVEPDNFDDFDYKGYLKNQNIFYILDNAIYKCFDISKRRAGSAIRNSLVDLKEGSVSVIDRFLHEPQSTLLAGVLFGKKRILERKFEENLRITGVSHIITASGYNITILIVMADRVFFFLPKKLKILFSLLLIWCFALFSGLGNSIIRACIMNSLSLVALLFGRDNRINISLPLASAIFLLFDPLIIFDVGFLLSVCAILGLIYISPILQLLKERIIKKLVTKFKPNIKIRFLDDYVFPTLSCTIGTVPIGVATFKTFTVWSVPVNAVVLPVLESTMLWGLLSVFVSTIHEPLSKLLFTVANLQLKYFEHVVDGVGRLGIGSWSIPENFAGAISGSIFLLLLLTVIYFYPIENEQYNFYLKDS